MSTMYCNECGAQIPENSKFCPHCGKRQDEGQPSLKEEPTEYIIENEITRQVTKEQKSLDYQFLRKAMGWYFAWILIHLGLLLIASESIFDQYSGVTNFWPLGRNADFDSPRYYDINEFLVYTIFPLAILIIWSMIRSQSKNSNK